jgi:hypothetical protein
MSITSTGEHVVGFAATNDCVDRAAAKKLYIRNRVVRRSVSNALFGIFLLCSTFWGGAEQWQNVCKRIDVRFIYDLG